MKPGDFFLISERDIESRAIQFASHSHWNHCGLITSVAGDTIEALSGGVKASTVNRFAPEVCLIVDSKLSDAQRVTVCDYAATCLNEPYDWLGLAGIGFDDLTHGTLVIGTAKRVICSAFLARCYETVGLTPPTDARLVSPGGMAQWFGVTPV